MTIETSASIENLASALGKFQTETHGVVRDATNPFHKNRYATLEAVIETARPALARAGLAFLQAPGNIQDGRIALNTLLMHCSSGEWIKATMAIPLTKTDPQGVGSAITYGCRYALMAMLGLPPLDDDAEATKPVPKAQEQPKAQERPNQALQALAQPGIAKRIAPASVSKQIYIANSIALINRQESAPQLLEWAKKERKMVWPQYGIEPHDEDGQRLVAAYKERMAVLEQAGETEAVE
jgi:hypothetical protein